ncbi:2-oxoacid:ferredoxin oxidoreductase subunit beta [Phaeocystidibacter luteus]|uniref:2-oxoacid:ferredoxin oxidoreductase subunit beta n=1 Tax=Phaeocystidibacter luteus TaxID=911197 RepID=A0A6N6RKQ4_9FLAO|nr:2-oxoacid:ferredoxin oxidoreductase subunit beta [Phaeocystidibacter luteus]KAB2813720.1 2-oxoacid:ferredoxin oxidoreductase subunit beta [Phaeocystidibacter luteus]
MSEENITLTPKDFATDQDVRWCPGCGDYSILKQVQTIMPELDVPKEDIVFISGIGCSSRFPYYMNTYGMHSIHGRATSVASGLKLANPNTSVWVVTGDGDGLSIGGNHLIHLLRRNLDVNILLFNNEIYGLTKGQYSPTSPVGQVTKSSPMGAIDHPFNPLALALGADATFIARTADRDPLHQREMLLRSHKHKGSSFLEIYQNCNVFNDGAFEVMTDKKGRPFTTLYLEHGKPLVFANGEKGIILDGLKPKVVNLGADYSESDLWIHDEHDQTKAYILTRMFEDPQDGLPRPFGVLYSEERPLYEDLLEGQLVSAKAIKGEGNLDALIAGSNTWDVK